MHSTVWEGAERLSSSARAPYALKIPSLPRSLLYGIRYSNLISPLFFLVTFIFIQIGWKSLLLETCQILFQKSVKDLTLLDECVRGWLSRHAASGWPWRATAVAGKFKFSSPGWREGAQVTPSCDPAGFAFLCGSKLRLESQPAVTKLPAVKGCPGS